MRSLDIYLKRMIEICNDAMQYTKGMDLEDFKNDKKTRDAVILMVIQLWELSNLIAKEYPSFLWLQTTEMKRARDILVHHYHKVDIDRVWQMATYYIPQVLEFLNKENHP